MSGGIDAAAGPAITGITIDSTTALADTGGIDLRFALAGIVVMAAGLVLLLAALVRRQARPV